MDAKKRHGSFHLLYLFIPLLLAVNLTLGFLLLRQSGGALIQLMQSRMLDIARTASSMLDGDVLARLTKADEDTADYRRVKEILTHYQENIDLQYIYCIRPAGGKTFVFSVDPTVEDPGEFGSPVVYTDALYQASLGTAAVDSKPYTDAWGTFYSAYAPVFTSEGQVGGIVAVDFSASWYDRQVSRLMVTTACVGAISLVIGILTVSLISHRNRRRYRSLYGQLNGLAGKVEELVQEIENRAVLSPTETEKIRLTARSADEISDIDALGARILSMQEQLRAHLDYVHAQAFRDGLTGVGNNTAYLNLVKRLESMIPQQAASFSVVQVDLNDLKKMNDTYGHESGDAALTDTAELLKKVWGEEQVFRTGGDEFTVIVGTADEEEIRRLFARMDDELAEINKTQKIYMIPLALSRGAATYHAGEDPDYKTVYRRADQAMYEDKRAYYMANGDRRRR